MHEIQQLKMTSVEKFEKRRVEVKFRKIFLFIFNKKQEARVILEIVGV